jgi:hypothetical protein
MLTSWDDRAPLTLSFPPSPSSPSCLFSLGIKNALLAARGVCCTLIKCTVYIYCMGGTQCLLHFNSSMVQLQYVAVLAANFAFLIAFFVFNAKLFYSFVYKAFSSIDIS